MNIEKNPDVADLKRFVSRIDDTAGDHVVWVDLEGNVHASKLAKGDTPSMWAKRMGGKFKCRLETLARGNGYLGKAAARDDRWMMEMLRELERGWRAPGKDLYAGC